MPPLFPLLFVSVFIVGAIAAALSRFGLVATAFAPAALVTGALFFTDWDFTVDVRAVLQFFLPAFLFALTGGLIGSCAGRKFRRTFG